MIRLLLALAMLVTPFAVSAQDRRVALVIANSSYAQIEPLANPVNDGKLVAGALEKVGFAVTIRDNLDLGGFLRALRDFRGQADGAEVALIYYAGHGIQADGENFLVPVDAEMAASPDLEFEGVGLERLMMTLGGAKMRVAILDACRNNPFKAASDVEKAVTGLAQVDVDDVLLIFSAAPGKTAADGAGSNSPFAAALAETLPRPGVPLQMMGGLVRDKVIKSTANAQRPHISASVTGSPFYLVEGSAPPAAAPTPSLFGSSLTSAPRDVPAVIMGSAAPEKWNAADPKLPLANVAVARIASGDQYKYIVSGTYPAVKRTGEPAPQARFIRILPRAISGNMVRALGPRRLAIGTWTPGAPFVARFAVDKALVDATPGFELRLCIGGEEAATGRNFCFYSPNLVEGGPQRLINVNPARRPAARPIAKRMRFR